MKKLFGLCLILCVTFSGILFAARLVEEAEAIDKIMPDKDTIERLKVPLTSAMTDAVNKRSGYDKLNPDSKDVEFIVAKKAGKITAVSLIDSEQGKWGFIEFMVAIDPSSSAVKDMIVLSFEEKRGRPIARRKFLDQFVGKTVKDTLEIGKDIEGVSGATVSSKAAISTVKESLIIFEEVYKKR